jgi:hypothetical protein
MTKGRTLSGDTTPRRHMAKHSRMRTTLTRGALYVTTSTRAVARCMHHQVHIQRELSKGQVACPARKVHMPQSFPNSPIISPSETLSCT